VADAPLALQSTPAKTSNRHAPLGILFVVCVGPSSIQPSREHPNQLAWQPVLNSDGNDEPSCKHSARPGRPLVWVIPGNPRNKNGRPRPSPTRVNDTLALHPRSTNDGMPRERAKAGPRSVLQGIVTRSMRSQSARPGVWFTRVLSRQTIIVAESSHGATTRRSVFIFPLPTSLEPVSNSRTSFRTTPCSPRETALAACAPPSRRSHKSPAGVVRNSRHTYDRRRPFGRVGLANPMNRSVFSLRPPRFRGRQSVVLANPS